MRLKIIIEGNSTLDDEVVEMQATLLDDCLVVRRRHGWRWTHENRWTVDEPETIDMAALFGASKVATRAEGTE